MFSLLFFLFLLGIATGVVSILLLIGGVYGISYFQKINSNHNKIIQLKKQLKENNELFKEAEAKIIEFKIGENYHAN